MLKPNQTLRYPADFDNAMYFALPIVVLQQGELIEEAAPIEKHSEIAVYINDGYFLKKKCEFRVAQLT